MDVLLLRLLRLLLLVGAVLLDAAAAVRWSVLRVLVLRRVTVARVLGMDGGVRGRWRIPGRGYAVVVRM